MAVALTAARETVALVRQAVALNDFTTVFKLFDDLYNLPLKLVCLCTVLLSCLLWPVQDHIRELGLIRYVKTIEVQYANRMGIKAKVVFSSACVILSPSPDRQRP